MNYSTNMKNKQRVKKIIISWVIVLVVGILIGWGITNIVNAMNKEESIETIAQFKEVQSYGTVDGKTYNWGMATDWTSGSELGFIPFEVEMDDELQEFIYCLSYGYNIDYAFVMGVMQTESEFKSDVVSSTNDYGLMQINKINHEWLEEKLGITDFLDPYQSSRSGLYILRNLFEKYEEPEKVLMAYNMGEGGAAKLWKQGIYETNYTNKVLKNVQAFQNYTSERMNEND